MRATFCLAAAVALAACDGAVGTSGDGGAGVPPPPDYRGVETYLLDGDLVNFRVSLRGAEGPEAVLRYRECAAAGYTLIRGYGYARHVRTQVEEEGGIWLADAVYTISPGLPAGLRTMDAEVAAAECGAAGIPTV